MPVRALSSREPACADEIVECSQLSYGRNRVTFPVTQCTEYSDRRQPSLRAMEEIAWVLRSDPKKNTIGFVKRAELTRRERFVLDDDEFPQDAGRACRGRWLRTIDLDNGVRPTLKLVPAWVRVVPRACVNPRPQLLQFAFFISLAMGHRLRTASSTCGAGHSHELVHVP